jgi:hypothetical protein
MVAACRGHLPTGGGWEGVRVCEDSGFDLLAVRGGVVGAGGVGEVCGAAPPS